jgi:hypothetical protein
MDGNGRGPGNQPPPGSARWADPTAPARWADPNRPVQLDGPTGPARWADPTSPVQLAGPTGPRRVVLQLLAVLQIPFLTGAAAGGGLFAGAFAQDRGYPVSPGLGAVAGAVLGVVYGLTFLVFVARSGTWLDGDVLVFRTLRTRRVELARARSVVIARLETRQVGLPPGSLLLAIVDEDGKVWWLQFRLGPVMAVPEKVTLQLVEALRRADCPGAGMVANHLAEVVATPAAQGRVPVADLPRSVATARWLRLVPILVMSLVVPAVFVPFMLGDTTKARAVPANVCALIPAALSAQVVPAGVIKNAGGSEIPDHTSCTVQTDNARADTTAWASLYVKVERSGGNVWTSRDDAARDDFARYKRIIRDPDGPVGISRNVQDIAALGDSAFLTVKDRSRVNVEEVDLAVHVLDGDTVLTVSYDATPTTEVLAASAAVAVARALLEELR